MLKKCFLPGFRTTYTTVGVLHVLMASSLFVRGLPESLREFQVPELLLQSPHYLDAQRWVYLHMIVIGLMIALLGNLAHEAPLQRWMSRLLCLAHAVYALWDFQASPLMNNLYHGPAALIPAFYSLLVALLFLHLSFCRGHASLDQTENATHV